MKELRSIMKNVVLTLALAFVMTLAGSAVAKADLVTPAQVTGLKQTDASSSSVRLEWQAQLTNGVEYEVEISTDKVNWTPKGSTSLNYGTIYDLNAGSTYYVRMYAYTEEYNSTVGDYVYAKGAYSAITEVVTAPNSEPSYVKKTNSTTSSITLEWAAVPGANSYCVYYKTGNVEKFVNVPATNTAAITTTLTGLTADSEYTVYVYADRVNSTGTYTAAGSSYESGYGYAVTPGKVTNVRVSKFWNTLGKVDVECDTISCADNYEAEVWTAYKKKDKKLTKAECTYSTISTTYLEKAALKKTKFFKVRMRAYSTTSDGTKKYGAWSSWTYFSKQPEVISMSVTNGGINIKFDKIDGANRYVIYASTKEKSGYKKIGTTNKTTYTIKKIGKKKIKAGKKYWVYVLAQKKVGKKYYSYDDGVCYSNTYTYY